jgi:hypothetical protein
MDRRSILKGISAGGTVFIAGCAEQGEAEIRIDDYDIPETGEVGKPVDIEITFKNIGDRDGTLDDTAFLFSPRLLQFDTVPNIDLYIPAGETAVWYHSFTPENAGQVTFEYNEEIKEKIHIEPLSKAPRIQRVELITGWETFGDVGENSIESTIIGSYVSIGIRYDYWFEGGTHNASLQAVIRNEDRERYKLLQRRDEQLTENTGWDTWEWELPFSTDGASPGEYEATVLVRDNDARETSEAVSTKFEIKN